MSIWLVARVLVGQEEPVIERLKRAETESYAPLYREQIIDKRSHRKRFVERRLFPCYLFVRTQLFYWLTEIDGVTSVVLDGESPARSTALDRFIDKTKLSEVDGFIPSPNPVKQSRFTPEARVAVLRGLFKGKLGEVLEACSDEVHVDVLMPLFGRQVPIRYSESDLAVI
jgi:transcription antitermination factor NusG